MKLPKSVFALFASLTFFQLNFAQTLSSEQQAKLNSLPPALRAQAMEELRKLQSQNSSLDEQPLAQPEIVTPKEPAQKDERIEKEFETDTDLAITEEDEGAKVINQKLEQFGYELFAGTPSTFAPAGVDVPVPVDYIIGPGDQVRIQFFGKETASYDLYVNREGVLQVPELGPLTVAGQSFEELKQNIARRVEEQMIGVQAFVTLGELRSIRVFMLGDVNRPGSYTVSALSTMTNALFVSGGISTIGSLRNVQLKRAGETVATLDLYDLLLRGDTSGDAGLRPGDVIFVPPVGKLAGVAGEVRRPAIYELAGEERIEDVIALAGGLTPQAYLSISQIERISDTGLKELIDLDLTEPENLNKTVSDGDTLRIYSTLDRIENFVRLEGNVERPGDYQWFAGIKVSDVVSSIDQLRLNADLAYSLVVSKDPTTGRFRTRSFSFEKLFLESNSEHDLTLNPDDRIVVFDDTKTTRPALDPIIERLKAQGTSQTPQKVVTITGRVRHPGEYPLDENMRVSDLIRAGGGFTEDAYTLEAELLRFTDNNKSGRTSILIPLGLEDIEQNNTSDIELTSFDQISVKRIPEWTEKQQIEIQGEVRFPGIYTLERGETLARVLERAGGLTELAHPESAVFLRESLRIAEAANLSKLRERLQSEIASASLQRDEFTSDSIDSAQSLLEQLEVTQAAGRLVIDLPKIITGSEDLLLKDGDSLLVPQKPQAVTIIGSVNYPTSHLYESGLTQNDYIALSGGLMRNADKGQIYVVRSNGRVEIDRRSRFFPKGGLTVQPGDTIVVPIDVDRIAPLKLWSSTSQIFYQIALGAAAINSF